jgi:hypothetical protein
LLSAYGEQPDIVKQIKLVDKDGDGFVTTREFGEVLEAYESQTKRTRRIITLSVVLGLAMLILLGANTGLVFAGDVGLQHGLHSSLLPCETNLC